MQRLDLVLVDEAHGELDVVQALAPERGNSELADGRLVDRRVLPIADQDGRTRQRGFVRVGHDRSSTPSCCCPKRP
jgi:hypothetical protein